jgi:hypothetical protein
LLKKYVYRNFKNLNIIIEIFNKTEERRIITLNRNDDDVFMVVRKVTKEGEGRRRMENVSE